MPVGTRIQLRRGTEAQWIAAEAADVDDEPLANGEPGIVTDADGVPLYLVVGDTDTEFEALPRFSPDSALSGAFVSWPAFTAIAGGVGFQNSWTNFGAPFAAASFRKSSDGTQLQLTGTIVGGTNAVAAFTLPSGYRPTTRKDIALWNSDSGTFISTIIGTDGQVVPTGGSLTRIHLDVVIQLTL